MPNPLIVKSQYLVGTEALLVHVDMSAYLIDYYLHRKKVSGGKTSTHQDESLKDLLACLAIHLTTRSAAQSHAWTLHTVSDPPFSLFATGAVTSVMDNRQAEGYLVGNILTEHIRHTDVNSLHAQFTDSEGKLSKSYVQSEQSDIARIVEHFYVQSEQQELRIHLSRTSDIAVGLVALPDFDSAWFNSVKLEEFAEQPPLPENIMFTWQLLFRCDCSAQKLVPFFRSIPKEDLDELYGTDEAITIACPRCGELFPIHRSELDQQAAD